MTLIAQPAELRKLGNSELKIVWTDAHESRFPFSYLRQHCRCATCVDEWSGKQILEREKVPATLEGLKVDLVGQYGLKIVFSDGHQTGIYTFQHLREICLCAACKSNATPAI